MLKNQLKTLLLLATLLQGGLMFGQCVTISCPSNQVQIADSAMCGAVVNYNAPVAANSCSQPQSLTLNYTGFLQTFTVPSGINTIHIDASGAQGGSTNVNCTATGGLGARMTGDFAVTPGEVLSIMVGQQGLSNGADAGGGGGTFVVRTGNVLLVAAGGGGGSTNNIGQCGTNLNGINASILGDGTPSGNNLVLGGTNGNGGGASGGSGGGGGGFLTDGIAGTGLSGNNGKAYVNGGAGGNGNNNDFGGYGGGGAGWFTGGNGGGGGGYSGGATSGNQPFTGGGGGGSYSIGTNQVNAAGFQTGNGRVILTYAVPGLAAVSMTQGMASGSMFPVGTTTVAYMVTDSAGSNDSCSFTVTVNDVTAPIIACPTSTIVASNDPGTCSAVVTYSVTATDDCPGSQVSMSSGLPSGSAFPVATSIMTFVATDASGNTSTCTFNIQVIADDSSTQNIALCDGETLVVGNSAYTSTGTYVDVLQNGGGCDSVVTTILTVAAPVNAATTTNGGTITATAANASYQWFSCDSGLTIVPGATGQSFTPQATGNYVVVVTEGNCSDTSSCELVVGIDAGILGTNVSLFPNPTSGQVKLNFGMVLDNVQIQVLDVAGRSMLVQNQVSAAQAQLDFSNFVNGIYFVKVSTANGQQILRVVKQD